MMAARVHLERAVQKGERWSPVAFTYLKWVCIAQIEKCITGDEPSRSPALLVALTEYLEVFFYPALFRTEECGDLTFRCSVRYMDDDPAAIVDPEAQRPFSLFASYESVWNIDHVNNQVKGER